LNRYTQILKSEENNITARLSSLQLRNSNNPMFVYFTFILLNDKYNFINVIFYSTHIFIIQKHIQFDQCLLMISGLSVEPMQCHGNFDNLE